MKSSDRNALPRCRVKPRQGGRAFSGSNCRAFTLIELILVMTLLVIITSIVVPTMSRFIRGRALGSETRRMYALMHEAQSRAVSEGMPMMLWLDEKGGAYGAEAETSGKDGDAKAEELTADPTLQFSLVNLGTAGQATFKNLPAIKFLADGTVDETSPQTVELQDGDGFARWLVLNKMRTGYEISETGK